MEIYIAKDQKFKLVKILTKKNEFTVTSANGDWNEVYSMPLTFLYDHFDPVPEVI
jgi:hypothetical protein